MPFRFRRSRNFGPFRITASKSGLSGSVGAGGARVGRSRRGTWVSLGLLGTGLSWYRRYNRKRR